MGHTGQILVFPESMSKKEIQTKCDLWGDHNCDLEERGWILGNGLGFPIKWTDRVFDCRDDAEEYLEHTFGNYRQTAVRFKEAKTTSAMAQVKKSLEKNLQELTELSGTLHYKNAAAKMITCKKCGSSIATAYCGKTWNNNCPVCKSDLRPKSTLDRIQAKKQKVKILQEKYREEERRTAKQNSSMYWAVACEVHS